MRLVLSAVAVTVWGILGFRLVEGWNLWECFYMTVITVSTVGFAEIHPLSQEGRLVAISIIGGGIFTSLKAANLIGMTMLANYQRRTEKKMQRLIDEMSDHVILCGYGRIGTTVRRELESMGKKFVVISDDESCREELMAAGIPVLIGDATTEESLLKAGVKRASGVIAAISSDAGNVFIVLSAHGLNPDVPIVARAENPNTAEKLRMVGATSVVTPYQLGGKRLAQAFLRPGAVGLADLAMGSTDNEVVIQEVELPANQGNESTFRTLDLGNRFGLIAIGVRPMHDADIVFNPGADYQLNPTDQLLVMGREVDVDRFRASFNP